MRATKETDLWPLLRAYWHPVALSADVPDNKPLAVRLLDERLAVCRLGGEVKAFYDLCVHRGCPISLGRVEGEKVVCAYHGWAYGGDGRCVRIPSIPPEHPIPKKARLTPYPAQEKYGLVWVCLADEPVAPIPDFPELEEPDYRMFMIQSKRWKGCAARVMENFVDLGHFAWIHDGLLGDRAQPITPEVHIQREGEMLRFWFQNIPDKTAPFVHRRSYRLYRPFTLHMRKEEPEGKAKVFYTAHTAHSANETTEYMLGARNYDLDATDVAHGPVIIKDKEIRAGVLDSTVKDLFNLHDLIFEQDYVIVENQRPEELPLDLTEELHVKGPDGIALAYRRMLREIGVDA